MEESEKTLNMFWENHFVRLNKCLDLRKFEQKFKDVSIVFFLMNLRFDSLHNNVYAFSISILYVCYLYLIYYIYILYNT